MSRWNRRVTAVILAAIMIFGMCITSYAAPSRTVVYNLNGATGTPPADPNVYSASPYRATILNINEGGGNVTAPAGKQFAGWSPLANGIANEWYAPGKSVIVSANGLELYAMWVEEKAEYNVTFRTKIKPFTVAPQVVQRGGLVTEPAPLAYEGYTFEGWYRDSSFRTKWNFATDTVTGDLILHAKWLEKDLNPWKVTYIMSEGVIGPGPVDNTTYSLSSGNARVKNIPEGTTFPGKVFAGWSTTPNRVLELKFRPGTNTADYVAVKQEGAKLYDVWVDANPAYSNAVTVDFSKEYQTMAGLGNALAFNKTSGYLQVYKKFKELGVPDEENLAMVALNKAVDAETGAKLEVFRMIIGDGGITAPDINPATGEKYEWGNRYYDGPNDTIWPEPGVENIVWNRPDWDTQKDKFDANQIWYVQKALEINPNLKVYGAAWSPPYWMKTNLGVRNDTPDNPNGQPKTTYPLLDEAYFADYAKYILDYAWGMYAWYGIPIYAVCPTNEPEIDHGYSALVFRGDDYERFLLDYVKPLLAKYKAEGKFGDKPSGAGMGFGAVAPMMTIAAPEGTRIDRSTSPVDMGTPDRPGYGAMMANPEIQDMVGVFTTHMYENDQFLYSPRVAGDDDPIYPSFMRKYGDIWMTEIGQQFPAYNEQNVADNFSMVNGLFWARRISNQFASDPGFTSYVLWNGTGSAGVTNDTARWINMLNAGSGQGTLPSLTGQLRIYKRFYTVAQFSRFINPGDIRVGADRVPFEGANVTAYKSADGKDFSIVALNEDNQAHTITITLSGNSATSIIPYRTSNSENMKRLDAISAADGVFTVTLPAMSMTTFVNDKGEKNLSGWNARDVFTTMEAEDNDGLTGGIVTADGIEISNGNCAKFGNFNFADGTGTPSANIHVLRMKALGSATANGSLEIRVEGPTGPRVGVFKITPSEEPTQYFAQIDTGDLFAYGVKDIYVTYKGLGKLFLDKFTFDSTAIADDSNLVVNSTLNTNANSWAGKGTTVSSVNELYYRTRSLKVAAGGSDVGAEADLSALPEAGTAYNVKAFFIPAFPFAYSKYTSYESGFVNGGTAEIRLQFYNGETLVASQIIASRDNINNIDWRQVKGTFVYSPPAEAFTSVKLMLSMSGAGAFYVDEVTLTKAEVETEEAFDLSIVSKIVAGYAANLPVEVVNVTEPVVFELYSPSDALIRTITASNDGRYVFRIEKQEAVAGTYKIRVKGRPSFEGSVECVIPGNLWSASARVEGGKTLITFGAEVSFMPAKKNVTIGGAVVDNSKVAAAGNVVTIEQAASPGQKVKIAGVKYPDLFPSYSFTFDIEFVGQ